MKEKKDRKLGLFRKISLAVVLLLAVAAVGFIVAVNVRTGIYLLCTAIFLFVCWKAFVQVPNERLNEARTLNDELRTEVETLKRKLEEKDQSPLLMNGLKEVCKLTLMEGDFSFVRAYDYDKGNMHFLGAVKVTMNAVYGLDKEALRFKMSEDGSSLCIANMQKGPLYCDHTRIDWIFHDAYKKRELKIGEKVLADLSAVRSDDAVAFAAAETDRITKELQDEISSRSIGEMDYISNNVRGMLMQKFQDKLPGIQVTFTELPDDSFKKYDELQEMKKPSEITSGGNDQIQ